MKLRPCTVGPSSTTKIAFTTSLYRRTEKAALKQFHTFQSRIFYIVQLGYFKARRQFFTFNIHDVVADASYVQQMYFPDFPLTDFGIAKGTRGK